MSTYTGSGARARGPAQRDGTRAQHPQPPKTPGELAAPAQVGMKAVAAGLIGSAALVFPATAAWASPGSAALATMPTGSTVHTAAEFLGSGAQFHAYPVSSPAHHRSSQTNAARTSSSTSAAPVNATLTADVTQTATPLYTATAQSTAAQSTAAQSTATAQSAQPATADQGTAPPAAAPESGSGTQNIQQPSPAAYQYLGGTGWRPGVPHSGQDGAWQDNAWWSGTGGEHRQGGKHWQGGERRIPWGHVKPVTTGQTGPGTVSPGGPLQPGNGSGTPGSMTSPPIPPITVTVPPMIPYTPNTSWQTAGAATATGTGAPSANAGGTSTASGTMTTTGSTAGSATSGTAVPVFNSSGSQVGVAETNPATGAVEFVGLNGNLLGVIVQQNGAVDLVGAGGAVLGSFAVNQANGSVIFMPATTATGTVATTAATTTAMSQGTASSAAPLPIFDSMGIQVGVAVTNPATGAVELVGQGGVVLGVVQQQNGAVYLVGAGGSVLGSFAVNQANGQIIFTTAG